MLEGNGLYTSLTCFLFTEQHALRRRRILNRWQKALTLINNPSLVAERMGEIAVKNLAVEVAVEKVSVEV